MSVKTFLASLFCVLNFATLQGAHKSKCRYNSCHPTKNGYTNVHVVAHTHDDVGWIRTVDQYYNDTTASDYKVKNILTSSFKALRKDPNRRFMYVESAFLFKWWKEQTSTVKKQFKKLINSGQLELVSGAWAMNDEATTNYQSIIDQFTLGLSKIDDTFGACGRPKIGWQIDPFGHSNEMASIFAQLGFDGLFLGRIDYQDKENRFKTRTAEMIWQGSRSLGKSSQIFTNVLYNVYWPPEGFCVDSLCGGFDYHDMEENWSRLVKFMDEQAKVYRTNNIILTMGGDFHFSQAEVPFRNLDGLIEYGNGKQNNGSKYHLIYSTPSCYLKAIHEEATAAKIKFPVVTDDFFPYASDNMSYWTGFYTSRPTLKRFERMGNNFLQVCKQLSVLANLDNAYLRKIDTLKEAMGVLQHHDAVSGTEQQHVANDYSKMLSKGFADCIDVSSESINKLLFGNPLDAYSNLDFPFTSCLLTNISQCQFTENWKSFVVTIYNPLTRPVNHHVRIPVTRGFYSVKGPNGEIPPIQMVPIPKQVLNIPGRNSNATLDLVFSAVEVPPLGFKSYYIMKNPTDGVYNDDVRRSRTDKKISIRLRKETGVLGEVTMNGKTIPVLQNFFYYQGETNGRTSGAYIFNPDETNATVVSPKAATKIHNGGVLLEVHQTFNEWVSQIIRVYPDENFVEFQWLVGPLPTDTKSKEVISRFTTELNSNSKFYTDSNGREMQERTRNLRPTFKLNLTQPISSNYYPVTSKILIRDRMKDLEVAVLTDRSQGGTSLRDGEIELMVHRNSLEDDGLGVDEPLIEEAFGEPLVVRGSHYLVVGSYNGAEDSVASIEKDLAQRKLLEAWTFLSPTYHLSYEVYSSLYKLKYSALNFGLPKNVQILTLEPWSTNKFLLRLEHVFEKNEDPTLSKPVKIDLKHLFKAFKIVDLRETTLGGNQWLDHNKPMKFEAKEKANFEAELRRLKILREKRKIRKGRKGRKGRKDRKSHKGLKRPSRRISRGSTDKFRIILGPMQIRTFIVKIKRNVQL